MFNSKKFEKSKVKKILAIRNDKIGDLVVSSNLIRVLNEEFPNSKLDFVASKENKELLEENKTINKIYVLNFSPRSIKDFFNYLKLSKKIKKEGYDLGIAIRGSFINILFLLSMGRVKYKIGFYTNKITKIFLDYSRYKDFKGHATHNMLKMVNEGLGTNYKDYWPEIVVSKKDKEDLKNLLNKSKIKKYLCLCVDASDDKRQWNLNNFDKIIKYIKEKCPKYKVVLVGMDKNKLDFLLRRNSNTIPFFKKNLRLVYLLFKDSSLVIAPDGGMMHLAWASKTKLIGMIPKNVILEDTKPLGENSKYLYKNMEDINIKEIEELIDKSLKIR